MNTMQYKGYYGSVGISTEDNILYGKLLFISPLITYEGVNAKQLESSFMEAVESYLHDCEADGIEPIKPCKGTNRPLSQPAASYLTIRHNRIWESIFTRGEITN